MPIAPSSTERRATQHRLPVNGSRLSTIAQVRDVSALVAFRFAGDRRRRSAVFAAVVLVSLTAVFVLLPAYAGVEALPSNFQAGGVDELLAGGLLGFVALAAAASAASGGGRELIARDQAVAYPLTPTTDHLGALLMSPLNLAWLVQTWFLMTLTALMVGPSGLVWSLPLLALWIALGSAVAQALGWLVEFHRRGPQGRVRLLTAAGVIGLAVAGLHAAERLDDVLAIFPHHELAAALLAGRDGPSLSWLAWLVGLAVATGVAVAAGVAPATAVARRPALEENRAESRHHRPRPDQDSDFDTLLRFDRASVLRSVPLRRGLITLILMPTLGALAIAPTWDLLVLLPGLVASGATLLFGVNAWCLDGRGLLWRENLPVAPGLAFDVRTWLLAEILAASSLITITVGALRSGLPTVSQLTSAAVVLVIVVVQVTATSMHWSVRRPRPADLRSARATPAPPLVMIGYSSRLALSTTLLATLFGALGTAVSPLMICFCALPFLGWSIVRLLRARHLWNNASRRCHVNVTVAAG